MADVQRMKAKVCLVGEGAVGKTALIRRFIHDQFDDRYISTLGAKVSKKEIVAKGPDGSDFTIDMTIWDIMGEKGFRELLKEAYFHGAQGVLAVCDLTRKTTVNELDDWIEGVYGVTGRVPVVFAGNNPEGGPEEPSAREELWRLAEAHGRGTSSPRRGRGKTWRKCFRRSQRKSSKPGPGGRSVVRHRVDERRAACPRNGAIPSRSGDK